MPQQKGNITVLLGFESTFKTPPAEGFKLQVNSFGLKASRTLNQSGTLNDTRNPTKPFPGNKVCRGPIVVPVDSGMLPYWLKALFGAPTSSGGPNYVHEFKIGDAQPSVTLEVPYTGLAVAKYSRFVGCKIAGFSLDAGGDGELVMSLDVVAADQSFQAAPFDAAPTVVSPAKLFQFQAAVTEGGASLTNAKLAAFSANMGLDDGQYVIGGQGTLGSIPEGTVEVAGRVRTLFEDTALLDKGAALTESGLKLTVSGAASSIFELEVQELLYEWTTPETQGPQGMDVELPFKGFWEDGSENSAIVARVTNGVASYA